MKKIWIIILIIAITIVGVVVGIGVYNDGKNKAKENNIIENKINEVSEKITDECTEQWEELDEQAKKNIEVSSSEEKISPNCSLTLKRYYKKCQHTIIEYTEIPRNLVNKTQEDLIKEYSGWEIKKYSSNEIIMYKEIDGECGEHFVLRNDNGKITIYRINENSEEVVYEKTEISVDYLTETDKVEIQNGIRVNGKEELNQLVENFE